MLRRAPLFGGKNRITFSLPAEAPDGVVSVVGDFNSWEPGRHVLVRRRNGTRSVSVVLPPGEHRFRYLATDGVWLDDDTADFIDAAGSWVHVRSRGGLPGADSQQDEQQHDHRDQQRTRDAQRHDDADARLAPA